MEFSNRFYAISDFQKERLRILYIRRSRALANESANQLQTICDPMIGFLSISLKSLG